MASKRQRFEDEDDDRPAWESWGVTSKEDKRGLPHASARKEIKAAIKAVESLDITMHIDNVVESMEAIATDVGRRPDESDGDHYCRVQGTLALIPTWSIDGTNFDMPHPYRGSTGLLYEHLGNMAAYKIPGDRWIDIYIGASACILLSEGDIMAEGGGIVCGLNPSAEPEDR